MPLKIDPRDRKLLGGAGIVFVCLMIAAAVFGGDPGQKADIPSSYSTAAGGAKAAYLLLAQEGYRERRWERPLDELPQAPGETLILAEPIEAPTREEREGLENFLRAGGRIIAIGMFAGTFLPENKSVPDFMGEMASGEVRSTRATAVSPSEITRAAPQIVMAREARWDRFSAAYPLYADGEAALVIQYPYGRGEVFWWAGATPLTNDGLKEPGNLEFFLASMGSPKNEILWDEYVHGYRETAALSIAATPVKWLLLQLTLLALAVLATFSRRSGPISKPATDVRLSPLEFVNTLGGLYENAGSASVALDICYQRFRYWLTRRLGVANNLSVAGLEAAVRERWGLKDDHFAAILRRSESAKIDPYLQGPEALHLVQELDEYAGRWKLFQGARKEKGE
jgi:hypothetical protein